MTQHAFDSSSRGELGLYSILRGLAIATAVVPGVLGTRLLIPFTQLRAGGHGQPGEWDGIVGLILLVFAGVHFVVAIPYAVCAAGVWYRKRWSFIAVAVLCAVQSVTQGGKLWSASRLDADDMLYAAYTVLLATCGVIAALTALSPPPALPSDLSRG